MNRSEKRKLLDTIRWYLLGMSLLAIALLVLIFILLPADEDSSRGHVLLNEIIPSAVVALAVVPVAYVFLYKHGLTLDQQLANLSNSLEQKLNRLQRSTARLKTQSGMEDFEEIIDDILSGEGGPESTAQTPAGLDVLVVVDLQNDFIDGSLSVPGGLELIPEINRAIEAAEANGMTVVFTRDWHPENHSQFKQHPVHCVADTHGAQIHSDIHMPENRLLVDFGIDSLKKGYSPFENDALTAFLGSSRIETVFVTGIALEYCVSATCIGAVKLGKRVCAVEPLIRDTGNVEAAAKVWERLKNEGVERCSEVPHDLEFKRSEY